MQIFITPLLALLIVLLSGRVKADTTAVFSLSGFAEAYYSYHFSLPAGNQRDGFVVSHNRHNEVNINLMYLKGAYETGRTRAAVVLAAGTYVNANYANEPGVLKNIYEAAVGIKLLKSRDVWVDAGIMPSHIGFESAYSPACYTLTRSILADNSPYYETGIRLSYTTKDKKWYMAALLLNGWQRIQRLPGNDMVNGGTQLTYTPIDGLTFNYSTFVGSDSRTDERLRIFHNFYAIWQRGRLAVVAGGDLGHEQRMAGHTVFDRWYAFALVCRYQPNKDNAVAARAEHYADPRSIILPARDGFSAFSYSANYDHYILPNVLWRIEGKVYLGNFAPAVSSSTPVVITTSLAATIK